MMRVAYICADPGVPVFGTKGSSVHVQEIVRAWRTRGADVTVYCTRAGTNRPADLADLTVVEIPPRPASAAERERAIEEAAIKLAVAAVRKGCDVIYERYSLFSPALAVVTDALGIPAVLEVNAPLIEEQQQYRQLHDLDLAEKTLRLNAGRADVVACVSEPIARWVRSRVPGAGTVLTPNGVNTERISPRPGGRANSDHLTVAFVGTLKPWHGVADLLNAVDVANSAAADPNRWTVRIIGDGPGRQDFERLAAELGVDAAFTGAVRPESVPALLHGCDAAAAPYPHPATGHGDYFSPLKVYEYLAAGMPVVASAVGQIPSILGHGNSGLLVPPGDIPALAAALNQLAQGPELRETLGVRARAAARNYSWNGVLATMTEALASKKKAA